jgi:hypothetical protein
MADWMISLAWSVYIVTWPRLVMVHMPALVSNVPLAPPSYACLCSVGWRFSVLEMQTILIELLANFEFRLPKDYKGVRRTGAATMIPTVPGNREAGTRLDLEVAILPDWNAPYN